MIELHSSPSPSGRRVSIALEEMGLPYSPHFVDVGAGDQKTPAFLAMNPFAKIPVIVDSDAAGGPLTLFESGAILVYLAEKSGLLLPPTGRARAETLQWLMFHVANVAPTIGQLGFFRRIAKETIPLAIERYRSATVAQLRVLEARLKQAEYLAGEYSIADVAGYPWIWQVLDRHREVLAADLGEMPAVDRWLAAIGARPGVRRGWNIPAKPTAAS